MADTEFGVGATLAVEVDQRSLADAKQTIEDDIGDVAVGVDGGAGGALTDGGMSGAAAIDDVGMIEELGDQTDLLEDILDELDGGVGTGGGGGGGGLVGTATNYLALSKLIDAGKTVGAGGGLLSMLMSTPALMGGAGIASGMAGMLGMGQIIDFFTNPPSESSGGFTVGPEPEQAAEGETVTINGKTIPIQNAPGPSGLWSEEGTLLGNRGPGDFETDTSGIPGLNSNAVKQLDLTAEEYQKLIDKLSGLKVPEPGWTPEMQATLDQATSLDIPEPDWLNKFHQIIRAAETGQTTRTFPGIGGGGGGGGRPGPPLPPHLSESEKRQIRSQRRQNRAKNDKQQQQSTTVTVNANVQVDDKRSGDIPMEVSREVQRQIRSELQRKGVR